MVFEGVPCRCAQSSRSCLGSVPRTCLPSAVLRPLTFKALLARSGRTARLYLPLAPSRSHSASPASFRSVTGAESPFLRLCCVLHAVCRSCRLLGIPAYTACHCRLGTWTPHRWPVSSLPLPLCEQVSHALHLQTSEPPSQHVPLRLEPSDVSAAVRAARCAGPRPPRLMAFVPHGPRAASVCTARFGSRPAGHEPCGSSAACHSSGLLSPQRESWL